MKIAEMCAEQINPADAKSRAADLNVRQSRNLIVERNYNKEGHW